MKVQYAEVLLSRPKTEAKAKAFTTKAEALTSKDEG